VIVCSCQNISDTDIRRAVQWMRASDPLTLVTAGKIYHALGKRADCGGCMPLFVDQMRKSEGFQVPATLRNLRTTANAISEEIADEGRRQGY
jgi:bacterioferritin-associated ferredoxin